MKKMIALIIALAVIMIGGGLGGAYYFTQVYNYITTDDAKVQGNLVTISSAAAGRLTGWNMKEGDVVRKGDVVGTVQVTGAGGAAQSADITAPSDGTVIQSGAVRDQIVMPGAPLAMTADLGKLYVVANVLETDLTDVKLGNKVRITVDAFPGTTFDGRVDHVGLATNSTFSLIPVSSSSGNYTKVAQRVPVYISLDSYEGKRLIPGLNASVRIER
jgi:multidrug resistance efflux pump